MCFQCVLRRFGQSWVTVPIPALCWSQSVGRVVLCSRASDFYITFLAPSAFLVQSKRHQQGLLLQDSRQWYTEIGRLLLFSFWLSPIFVFLAQNSKLSWLWSVTFWYETWAVVKVSGFGLLCEVLSNQSMIVSVISAEKGIITLIHLISPNNLW